NQGGADLIEHRLKAGGRSVGRSMHGVGPIDPTAPLAQLRPESGRTATIRPLEAGPGKTTGERKALGARRRHPCKQPEQTPPHAGCDPDPLPPEPAAPDAEAACLRRPPLCGLRPPRTRQDESDRHQRPASFLFAGPAAAIRRRGTFAISPEAKPWLA